MPGQQPHDYAEEEMLYNRFTEPALREGLSYLAFPKTDGTVLDAGCGPGGLFPLLLEALGPSGALVAIDRSTPHLRVAEALIASQELQERVKIGVKKEAVEVVYDGADSGVIDKTPNFIKSRPVWKAMGENTLIAFEMNGAPLPHWNGFPAQDRGTRLDRDLLGQTLNDDRRVFQAI